MSVGIQNFANIDNTDPSQWPDGQIKDDIYGITATPANRSTWGDIYQTFAKLLRNAGFIPNGELDGETHGYQYFDAMVDLIEATILGANRTGAWINAPVSATTSGGGSITIDSADIVYSKYTSIGKTFTWQIQLRNVTLSGSPTTINMDMAAPTGLQYQAPGLILSGLYNGGTPVNIVLGSGGTGFKLQLPGGAAFTNGTNNQSFDLTIRAEI